MTACRCVRGALVSANKGLHPAVGWPCGRHRRGLPGSHRLGGAADRARRLAGVDHVVREVLALRVRAVPVARAGALRLAGVAAAAAAAARRARVHPRVALLHRHHGGSAAAAQRRLRNTALGAHRLASIHCVLVVDALHVGAAPVAFVGQADHRGRRQRRKQARASSLSRFQGSVGYVTHADSPPEDRDRNPISPGGVRLAAP